MQSVLTLRPRTLLPLTSLEEERILSSLPETTIPLNGHPLAQEGVHSAPEQHQNTYVHRFRRKLILRQKRRNNPFMHQGFNLDQNVREVLRNWDVDDARLTKYHSSRVVNTHLTAVPEKRSVPTHLMSKLRRTDHIVADEQRLERRRQLASERLPSLAQTQLKLQQVQQRAQVMQAWIAHEDDLAIRNLTAMAHAEAMDANHPIATSQSMEITSGLVDQHPKPTSETSSQAMDVTVELTAAESITSNSKGGRSLGSSARDSAPATSISAVRAFQTPPTAETSADRSKGVPVERYSFAVASQDRSGSSGAALRSELRLHQLHEMEKRSNLLAPQYELTSADMERYLAHTLLVTESLTDSSLDCTGNPLTMEEEVYGDVHQKRALMPITSPWSGRILKPIIRLDYQTECKKLLLLREIVSRYHMALPEWIAPPASPIEYRYLRPHMIPQVNNLLRETFWPTIDISESILYPEFSIVVLYKELVIGCAFVTTLGYITYICVHPEWRSSGIAKFMLYHLIQTSAGKDITLHVSTTNPAVHLYQRFCFLIDETIPNFYDKYLPSSSPLSRDAFFMRLKR
jgi:GNAT superfamily N-acetyltransferase